MNRLEITYRRTAQGAWELSALVGAGYHAWIEHAQYFGYDKRTATRLFRERCAELVKP